MRKVIVNEFLTLDGVMQAPGDPDEDRSGGFPHGGWQMPFFDDVAGAEIDAGMGQAGGYLLGRRTYEIMAAYWPTASADDPFTATMNAMPKHVASTTLREPLEWQNSTLIQGDVAKGVAELKEQDGKDLHVIGSGELARSLMENGLVDEYRLMINPIVLGSGMRLFEAGVPTTTMRLVDSKTSSTGVLIVTYAPAEA
jgi:dihydrofolate reductase